MVQQRRYSKKEKISAVTAAVASSTLAAAEKSGIPRSTLRYWMHDPDLAEIRHNAREELAAGATIAAHMAWAELIKMLKAGALEPRDVITAAGIATQNAQLLSGAATSRTETKTLTDDLDDHERQALRDVIDRAIAESAAATPEPDPVGAGAEVRE